MQHNRQEIPGILVKDPTSFTPEPVHTHDWEKRQIANTRHVFTVVQCVAGSGRQCNQERTVEMATR